MGEIGVIYGCSRGAPCFSSALNLSHDRTELAIQFKGLIWLVMELSARAWAELFRTNILQELQCVRSCSDLSIGYGDYLDDALGPCPLNFVQKMQINAFRFWDCINVVEKLHGESHAPFTPRVCGSEWDA